MAIVQPDKLLVDYPLYKTWNGFVIPQINDEDKRNGLTTPELKYQAWARYTQNILNVVLQEELDNIGYDLELIKPGFQSSLIKIMITRLMRAFSNDELIPRDSQVQLSQQGGIQYSSAQTFDAKSALYSFFNGPERAMIETSGLLEDTFSVDIEEKTTEFDNEFGDGVFVPDVKWGDKQDVKIVLNGANTTILQALEDLSSGKVASADLVQAIQDATGLTTTSIENKISVLQDKYIEYASYKAVKGDNEVAQVKDVKDSEARGRADIVGNQKEISKLKNNDKIQDERIQFLEALEMRDEIIDLPETPHDLTGDATTATFDLKTIVEEDPASPGQLIQKFNDFSDGTVFTIELFDPSISSEGTYQSHSFRIPKSGTFTFASGTASDTYRVSIANDGILTVLKTNGNTPANSLKITEIAQETNTLSLSTQQVLNLINLRVKSQLIEGANGDFVTFANLKALVKDDDFVAISFAAGETVTGRVSDNGDPLIITGYVETNGSTKWGNISIANDLTVSGGNDIANSDLSNVNVGTANAGKILQVKADGTIEYVDKPSGSSQVWKPAIINGNWLVPKTATKLRVKLHNPDNDFFFNNPIIFNIENKGKDYDQNDGTTIFSYFDYIVDGRPGQERVFRLLYLGYAIRQNIFLVSTPETLIFTREYPINNQTIIEYQ